MADNTLNDFENLGNQIKDAFKQFEANRLNQNNNLSNTNSTKMSETTTQAAQKPVAPTTVTTPTATTPAVATPAVNNAIPQSEGMYYSVSGISATEVSQIPSLGQANGTNKDKLTSPVTPVETPAGSGHYEVDITNLTRNYRGGTSITDKATQLSTSIANNGLQAVGGEIKNAVVTIDQADATSAPKVKLSFDAVPQKTQSLATNFNAKGDTAVNNTPGNKFEVNVGTTTNLRTGQTDIIANASGTKTQLNSSQTASIGVGASTTAKPAISSVIITTDKGDLNQAAKNLLDAQTKSLPNTTTTQNQTPRLGR
jgi:hypothetical protein